MKPNYTIWILSPPDFAKSHIFDELAASLQASFVELGFEAKIVRDPSEIKGAAIVLGANFAPKFQIELPEGAIIFNLEHIHPDSKWCSPSYGYIDLLKTHPVWDYSRKNIEILKQMGIENAVYCGIGYSPALSVFPTKKQDIDVVFVGEHHPRRKEIFDGVAAGGARFHHVHMKFGKERDEWLARGKIHLNVHCEAAQVLELLRVSYLLANGCFVISEAGSDVELEEQFKDGVVFCRYEEMVEKCLYYLQHPKERKKIAAQGLEVIKRFPQSQYVASALEQHRQLFGNKKTKPAKKLHSNVFTIWLIKSPVRDYQHIRCFEEVAQSLQHAFRQLGYDVPIVRELSQARGRVIAMGGRILHEVTDPLPEGLIIYNFEQVHENGQWFEPGFPYINFLRRYPVWDYSYRNIEALKKLGVNDVTYCGIGYAPLLSRIDSSPVQDIDVLFVGTPHPRRDYILNELRKRGLNVHVVHGQYGVERDAFIARSKIVINIHMQPANVFEIVRVSYLLANAKCVVSEVGDDKLLEVPFSDAVVFAAYEDLVETCIEYVNDDAKRRKQEQKALSEFAAMPQRPMLEQTLKELGQRKVITPATQSTPRVFVAIASFRDKECQHTVADMFAKAKDPARIHVGICLQLDPEDKGCDVNIPHRASQVHIDRYPWQESKGANWGRDKALKFMNGEDYVLLVDSHMRFEQNWDQTLIDMLMRAPSEKAVLSAYCPNYEPPDQLAPTGNDGLRMRIREIVKVGDCRLLSLSGSYVSKSQPDVRLGLYPSPFCIANCMFMRSSTLAEIPLDPYIHFWGDEMNYSARLWTHGYDIFQIDGEVIYHNWYRPEQFHMHHYRPTETSNNVLSLQRINHLLGLATANDPQALKDIERYGLGKSRPLETLWKFAGIDWQHNLVSLDAKEGRWNVNIDKDTSEKVVELLSPETSNAEAPPVVAMRSKRPKIFVNIASYRDPECQWTIKDLYEKAKYPDRINIGVCWQFDEKEDQHCFQVVTRPNQVKIIPVDWREAEGVCWARKETQGLWDGEEYTFMTDSHMRFVPGWDEEMIMELDRCESNKPLLSSSPASYEPPNHLGDMMRPTFRRVRPFTQTGNMRCQAEAFDSAPPKPLNGAFVVCNNIFSRSEITPEVPYDPYLYFDQEEIMYSARLYTHGWDVFSASKQLLYHYYNTTETKGVSARPLHWTDMRKEREEKIRFLYERGLRRFNHLTRHALTYEPAILVDIEKYGFGKVRTLEQYEDYTGIDFKHKKASEKALRGLFIKDIEKYRARPVYVPEIDDIKETPKPVVVPVKQAKDEVHHDYIIGMQPKQHLPALPEVGDFIPLISAVDTNNQTRALEVYAGKHAVLVFLPMHNPAALSGFFTELDSQLKELKLQNIWQIFIMTDTAENLIKFKEEYGVKHHLWADPDRNISRAFGLSAKGEEIQPTGFVLSRNLQILHCLTNLGPARLATALAKNCKDEVFKYREANKTPRIITANAPAIIVPNVFSPEFCKKCINAFHSGHNFEGLVGAEQTNGYKPDTKIRRDHIVSGSLLEEADYKLSRSFFPEIEKIFGFKVMHREFYKIGLYSGEKKGFFKQHRDNFDAPLGYRRIAATIQLSDDYEGGGLKFPEYDENIYRPPRGAGIAFSCQTVHEALPVTKGERYVMVLFLYGSQDEAYRQSYVAAKGDPLYPQNYLPTLRSFPNVKLSRDFYKEWYDKNVTIKPPEEKK